MIPDIQQKTHSVETTARRLTLPFTVATSGRLSNRLGRLISLRPGLEQRPVILGAKNLGCRNNIQECHSQGEN